MNTTDKQLRERLTIYLTSLLQEARRKLYDIDIDYFDCFARDCEEIPQQLNLSFRSKVVDSYMAEVTSFLTEERLRSEAQAVCPSEDIAALMSMVWTIIHEEFSLQFPDFLSPKYSDEDLETLYENACRRTIIERLARSNYVDIALYHEALLDSTACECRAALLDYLKGLQ